MLSQEEGCHRMGGRDCGGGGGCQLRTDTLQRRIRKHKALLLRGLEGARVDGTGGGREERKAKAFPGASAHSTSLRVLCSVWGPFLGVDSPAQTLALPRLRLL